MEVDFGAGLSTVVPMAAGVVNHCCCMRALLRSNWVVSDRQTPRTPAALGVGTGQDGCARVELGYQASLGHRHSLLLHDLQGSSRWQGTHQAQDMGHPVSTNITRMHPKVATNNCSYASPTRPTYCMELSLPKQAPKQGAYGCLLRC